VTISAELRFTVFDAPFKQYMPGANGARWALTIPVERATIAVKRRMVCMAGVGWNFDTKECGGS